MKILFIIDWLGISIYSALSPVDNYGTKFTEQMDEVYPRITTAEIGQGNKPMLLEFAITRMATRRDG